MLVALKVFILIIFFNSNNRKLYKLIFFSHFIHFFYILAATQAETFLSSFCLGIRRHRILKYSHVVFCCERNMAHEAGFLAECVKKTLCHERISFICQRSPGDCGWWTQSDVKYKMGFEMRYVFMNNIIQYSDDVVCTNPFMKEATRWEETKKKFEDQLPKYKIVVSGVSSLNPLSTPRIGLSGKTTKEGKVSASFTDDLVFCVGACLYFIKMILTRSTPHFNHNELLQ